MKESDPKSIAIIYHSAGGRTKAMAEAVKKGSDSVGNTACKVINIEDIENNWNFLDESDAIIFGCPTYMGSVSSEFKKFMDDSSSRWMKQRWKDKIAAGFTSSGSYSGDKLGTLIQLVIFATQHSMIWVGLDAMPDSKNKDGVKLNRLGSFLGAMSASSNDDENSENYLLNPADAATAERLGERVAEFINRNPK